MRIRTEGMDGIHFDQFICHFGWQEATAVRTRIAKGRCQSEKKWKKRDYR